MCYINMFNKYLYVCDNFSINSRWYYTLLRSQL
uniref:Uncharacterized protein n=1 Tax=Anguilla anguilla TaxID=7936 RepID=A0A0E9UE44_ANGAN